MRRTPPLVFLSLSVVTALQSQIRNFPYVENFDGVTAPALPGGWTATGNFATTSTTPVNSPPNAILSTNATTSHTLVSPQVDLTGKGVDKLVFYQRRSATHNSGILIEASTDGGLTFPIRVSDTLKISSVDSARYGQFVLSLPSALNNQSNVKIRWRIIGNGTGTSGTYRLDDVSITVRALIDLAIRSVSWTPPLPVATDTMAFKITVENLGVQTTSNYSVELFDDVNRDSVGQPSERIAQLSPPSINPGDSLTVQATWTGFSAGEHQILAVVTTAGDENAANNRRIINFLVGLTPRLVVINEIMYAPSSPEPEWIELYNTTADSVNIKNWKITDNTGVKITVTTQDRYIRAKGFVVLTHDSAFFAVRPGVPSPVIVLNLPALNNTGDAVVIFDSRNIAMDSLTYTPSWGGSGGRSLERILPDGPSTDQANWGTSVDPSGGSPGRSNSLTQKDNDLALRTVTVSPAFPSDGDNVTLTARVANAGKNPAGLYAVAFFEDANGDSAGQESELISRVPSTATLQPGDSADFGVQVLNVALGLHRDVVVIEYGGDEDLLNNTRVVPLAVGLPQKSVVINEIMYAPSGGEPEWIEIYNTSTTSINLRNWKLSNRITTTKYTMSTTDILLPAKGFAVVTRDSLAFQAFHPTIPGLLLVNSSLPIALFSNSGDGVVLFDDRSAPMDSLFYSPSWGGSGGRSLERIVPLGPSTDQSNWGSSFDPSGSTPGRINTIGQRDNDLGVRSFTFSPAVPVAGNAITLTAKVANVGLNPASNYALSFYEDANGDSVGQASELIRRISSTGTLQPGDSVAFSAQVLNVASGDHRYLATVEYSADESAFNDTRVLTLTVGLAPRSVVINEVMYGPTGGEPEWVELYNGTSADVNLRNWRLSNRTTSTKHLLSSTDVLLRAFGYAVITKDPSILNFHASVPSTLVVVPALPAATFSNSGDAVVLYDSRTATMDSLTYTPGWGGTNGRSLERIDFEGASTDSTNWGTSTDLEGSTPGRQNSNARLDNDLKAARVFLTQGETPQPGTPLPISATIQNVGRQSASGFSVKFYSDANRDSVLTPTELLGTVTPSTVLSGRDSTHVQFTWQSPASGLNRIAAAVEYGSDQRARNNVAFTDISIGSRPGTLIINEIMYEPLSGQAEWVELYNPGNVAVDLTSWALSDMKDAQGKSNVFSITKASAQVGPKGFAVISSDSTIFSSYPYLRTPSANVSLVILNRSSLSLNNEGDDVVITDLVGTVIDSVRYSPSWHNPDISSVSGISLERINPSLSSNDRRNWSSSVDKAGGTPGRQNSIYTTAIPSQTTLSISPNPFSPDGDGFEDFAVISYELPAHVAQIRLKIFDSVGRLVRTLANNEPSSSRGQVIWDGLDDEKRRLRMGIYVIFLEAIDSTGGVVESAKAAAVVAGKL